jgi:tRNA-dihydrouridine synthase
MIARASVGRPWLFEQIRAEYSGDLFVPPNLTEIGRIFLVHIEKLIELETEKLAILQSRKLAKYYARTLPGKGEFVLGMQQATSRQQVVELLKTHYLC